MNPPDAEQPPRQRRRKLLLAAGLLALALLGLALPWLDLGVSALFYRPGAGFFLDRAWPMQAIYKGTRWFVVTSSVLLIASFFYAVLPTSKWPQEWRGRLAFLLLSLAIGPGLVTNTLLKDHWGRPRPEQIRDFGGHAHYVAPLVPSTQCKRNCSFPSGHAAAGFWLISGAWLWPRRRRTWWLAGCALGGIIGLVRIAQGGHFLSDVLGALAIVWLTDALLFRAMHAQGWVTPFAPQDKA
jgi:lipid A 4'-phosphatase